MVLGDCHNSECFHSAFSQVVELFPDKIALISENGNHELTYKQLDIITRSLAIQIQSRRLQMNNFTADHNKSSLKFNKFRNISVMTDRNFAMVIAIIAVLKSGASFVPVDPIFPADRQTYILSHSQSDLLLTDNQTYEKARKLGVQLPPIILLDSWCLADLKSLPKCLKMIHDKSIENGSIRESDSGLAYILYTSGSTGRPKGVAVTREGLDNTLRWFARELQITEQSVILGLTTICFDISMLEIFLPLMCGGRLVIADSDSQRDPNRLLDVIRARGVTVVQATPTTFEMMMATGWRGDKALDVLVGGEAFRQTLSPLITHCKSVRNVYGPTETTIWSSCYDFQGQLPQPAAATGLFVVPIGKPISNTIFYVVEVGGPPYILVPPGGEGELWIGGVGVAQGYLNAPELTAKNFVSNPFEGDEGGCEEGRGVGLGGVVYRTGDLVRQLENGNYVFVSRLDEQVKLNGYRIELAEVEGVLTAHGAAGRAVVVARDGYLVACVEPITGHSLDAAALKEHAARSLPKYMIPRHIVVVQSFPQTANGKLDKRALVQLLDDSYLPSISIDRSPQITAPLVADGTMLGHVCAVVQRLRGHLPGPCDSFAAVGIDSLGSALFLAALSSSLGGLRVYGSMVYGPGVTVSSLSLTLFLKAQEERPDTLRELGISSSGIEAASAHTWDSATGHKEERCGDFEVGAKVGPPSGSSIGGFPQDESLDDRILANQQVLQGVRGMLMLLVLWDHFHNVVNPVSYAWTADTSMFVLLSGFTTELQRRSGRQASGPRTAPVAVDDKAPGDSNCDELKVGPMSMYARLLSALSTPRSNLLAWRSFLYSRAAGLFPTLWLALVLNAPRWYYRMLFQLRYTLNVDLTDRFSPSVGVPEGVCAALYVVGLNSIFTATKFLSCRYFGPYDTIYASNIWVCFLIYVMLCILLETFQRLMREISLHTNTTSGVGTGEEPVSRRRQSWLEQCCRWVEAAGECRLDRRSLVVYTSVTWLVALLLIQFTEAASLLDNLLFLSRRGSGTDVGGYCALPVALPCAQYSASVTPGGHIPRTARLMTMLLAVTPDLLVVAIALLLALTSSAHNELTSFHTFHLIPLLFCALLITLLLQPAHQRRGLKGGLWRRVCESRPVRWLGYASYPIYMLQQVLLNFYFRALYDHIRTGSSVLGGPYRLEEIYGGYWDNRWFGNQPEWWKPLALIGLTAVCWLVQRFFQDTLVAGLLARLLVRGRGAV